MINKKILVIAPYPIVAARHGGQKRVAAMVKKQSENFKSVKFVGIFHKPSYPDFTQDDIPLGQVSNLEAIDENPLAMDQIIGKSIDNDAHVRSHFAKVLIEYRPDIIQVEHVFLYDGLSVLLKELNMWPKLIYSSHNIEHVMKAEIYKELEVDKKTADLLVRDTGKLEERFSKQADLVIGVSKEDALLHKKMGAKNVIVIPNGISPLPAMKTRNSKYKAWKRDHKITKFVTFVGSGHPPNYQGIIRLIGLDTSFLPKDSRFVLGGGVSEYFRVKYPKNKYPNLWKRLIATGPLEENELADLIEETDVFALPILSGGGSNLKTAEAILADKKIVATQYAFRGFEEYLKLPNVYIANDAHSFKQLIKQAIESPRIARTNNERLFAQKVEWEYCLAPMGPAMCKLVQKPTIKGIKHRAERIARGLVRRARQTVKKT